MAEYLVGDVPWLTLFDEDQKCLYISEKNTITKLDVLTGAHKQVISRNTEPWALAIDSKNNMLWVSNYAVNTVTNLNISDGKRLKNYQTGKCPIAMLYDSVNDALWVANAHDSTVSKIKHN